MRVPSDVEPVISPVEAVDTAVASRAAGADAAVLDAWSDHHEEIYAFLVRTTRSHETAEDLLQEAFLRLTGELRSGRSLDNPRAWLYRVAANLATSRGRRVSTALRGLARIRATAPRSSTDGSPELDYLRREGRAGLIAALDELRPAARAALLLSAEGFSGAEIAVAIGRSEVATRTLLSRTRVLVRHRLEATEGMP
jgi:RNA polymerase sigma-70 factor (ECF subfamily)